MIEQCIERGWVPDSVTRMGIRRLLRERLSDERRHHGTLEEPRPELIAAMQQGPIALSVDRANDQHYEQPPRFFELILGPWLKYSSGLWSPRVNTLAEAEEAMLRVTCERAALTDGMRVLDLGCGWGSLTRWVARHYPGCEIVAVSNSHAQRRFVESRLTPEERTRVRIQTADINEYDPDETFDRIISIEMFEHMRNYRALLRNISNWLSPDGRLFVHIFCHRRFAYFYEIDGQSDWMARHFFTGGLMPSENLLSCFGNDLRVVQQWTVEGTHYARTLEAWLERLDDRKAEILDLFRRDLANGEAVRVLNRWRVFLMACAELFAYGGGDEWKVGHYLLEPVRQ
jgi:cyclopropane-fatty-acyl-phospholipid synthase